MKILIVEDEFPTAEYTQRLCREILQGKFIAVQMVHELDKAKQHIEQHNIDLCLLDLNLHGESGYELLKKALAQTFHTIIISAYPDQALEAFQYGVLDFIVKPYTKERLQKALHKLQQVSKFNAAIKYLSIRNDEKYNLVKIDNITHIKSAGPYAELYMKNGATELLQKSMTRLEQMLPAYFFRAHRTCFVNLNEIATFQHTSGGNYQLQLKNSTVLPLSRNKYKTLYNLFNSDK